MSRSSSPASPRCPLPPPLVPHMRDTLIQVSYLIASVLFILGLRSLTRPDRARRGMQKAAFGMLFAIAGTLLNHTIVDYRWIAAGLVIGVVIGYPMGMWVPMTAMPQRIALSLTFSALAATLVGVAEFYTEITSGGVSDAWEDGGARVRDHARLDHRRRNDHRRGQAAGMDHVEAGHVQRTESRQRRCSSSASSACSSTPSSTHRSDGRSTR